MGRYEQHLLEARALAAAQEAQDRPQTPLIQIRLREIGIGPGHKDSHQDEHDEWVLESVRLRAE